MEAEIPVPRFGLYFPHHPLVTGSPSTHNRYLCFVNGHLNQTSHWRFSPPRCVYVICVRCSLYVATQYPPLRTPTITLPIEQAQGLQH